MQQLGGHLLLPWIVLENDDDKKNIQYIVYIKNDVVIYRSTMYIYKKNNVSIFFGCDLFLFANINIALM